MPRRGERVGDAYVEIHADGDKIDDDIRKGFANADKDVDAAGRRHSKRYGDSFGNEEDRAQRLVNAIRRSFSRTTKIEQDAKRLGTRVGDWMAGGLEKGGFDETIVRRFNKIELVAKRLGKSFDSKPVRVLGDELENTNRKFRDAVHHADSFRGRMAALDDRIQHYADVSGRAFGRGARNDAINLFGATVRGFTMLGRAVPVAFRSLSRVVDTVRDMRGAFKAAGGGMDGVVAAGSQLGGTFKAVARTGVGLAIGLGAIAAIIGPIISLFSGLVAATVALGGSLAFAASAGVGALAGTLAPLTAGIGVAALAFIGMNKAQKKLLSDSVKPLTKELGHLGQVARDTLITKIADNARRLAPVFKGLEPTVKGIAVSLGKVADEFVDGLNSPAFGRFRRDMEEFLPTAVLQLGRAFNNTFAGLGGLFRALIPITSQFLGWLDKITKNFAEWANSARGQEALKGFFERAAKSAKSVGRFLKEATVALGELLSQGRSSGDNIFDSMANALRRFTNYLRANPDAVHNWFVHGVETAKALGNAIVGISEAFASLDTASNRGVAHALLKGIEILAKGAAVEIRLLSLEFRVLAGVIGGVAWGIGKTIQGLGWLAHNDSMKNFGKDLAGVGQDMMNFAVHGEQVKKGGQSAATGFQSMQRGASGLKDTLDQVTGAATRATREFIKHKLAITGSLAVGNAWGASTRDMIGAVTGNAAAIGRVNAALKRAGPLGFGLRATLKELGVQFDSSGRAIRQNEADLTTWREALSKIHDKKVKMAIEATGMRPTLDQFKTLIATAHLTPRQIRIAAKATNAQITDAQLKRLIKSAKDLGKQKPTVHPDVKTAKPSKQLADISGRMLKVKQQKVDPSVIIKIDQATRAIATVIGRMGAADRSKADPRVTVRPGNSLGVLGNIINMIGRVHDKVATITTIHRTVGGGTGPRATAAGKLVNFAQERLVGEAGPEAIVPLNRPLGQVDPSVRWLSAIAQGIKPAASGGVVGAGRSVNIQQLTMVSNSPDPRTAASEFLNRLVAVAY